MSESRPLRAYVVSCGIAMNGDTAVLAFAPNGRVARKVGFDALKGLDEPEWLRVRAQWVKEGANVHRIAEKEAAGVPYSVMPEGCEHCCMWFADHLINDDNLCEWCQ